MTYEMKERAIMRAVQMLTTCGMALTVAIAANAQEIDWNKVDTAIGKTAALSGAVHRYGFPRSDLQVTVDGVAIKPTLALGGWTAFMPMGGEAMVMGDLVLLETEVKPVMAKLLEGGIDITAVHNHLLRANPETFYMHIGGHGDPVKMAEDSFRFGAEQNPIQSAGCDPGSSDRSTLRKSTRSSALKAQSTAASYQFNVPRAIRSPRAA